MSSQIKHSVLTALLPGRTLSGETLSQQLGISRMAVWKAIDALRKEGYDIQSSTRVGYRLTRFPNGLSLAELQRYGAETAFPGAPLYCHEKVAGSTNQLARELALNGAVHGTAVIADEQTGGRGRLGRPFHSPPGVGLYLSLIARPDWPMARLQLLTVYTAVMVSDAIETLCGVRPRVKWVNDLLMDGLKVTGILTELATVVESGLAESVVIGIGVNCNGDSFPPHLRGIAGSIESATGHTVCRAHLAAVILKNMSYLLNEATQEDRDAYLERYRAGCETVAREVTVSRGEASERGLALSVSDTGGLVVRFADRVEEVRSGEVTLHTP